MRIVLDIPESEMAQAVHLIAMRGKVLHVTIELENDTTKTINRRQAKQRNG